MSGGEPNGGKAGRGSEHKVPFVSVVETSDEGGPRQGACGPKKGEQRGWRRTEVAEVVKWAQQKGPW